jgi:hypothetical protein
MFCNSKNFLRRLTVAESLVILKVSCSGELAKNQPKLLHAILPFVNSASPVWVAPALLPMAATAGAASSNSCAELDCMPVDESRCSGFSLGRSKTGFH